MMRLRCDLLQLWMYGLQPYPTSMSLYTSVLVEGSDHLIQIAAVPHELNMLHARSTTAFQVPPEGEGNAVPVTASTGFLG